ncbi:hypothetical protein [Methylophilus aquaticus]|uniref:Uncharacterized protein n=1 Tax=Methylophilus aquaticus TaxID=1971610 RepID=A0ABT9JV49_9PROT|nr:hypothetical protein [Methylophilus aquaticus]MDP8568470.1 hypothetical protein [Methylophilus aquaticus]
MKKLRARRHPVSDSMGTAAGRWRQWPMMVPVVICMLGFVYWGLQQHWDVKVLAGLTLLVGLMSGAFVWIIGLIGLLPVVGPIVVKVLSFGFIWLLNALGYLVSYIAIRRGYSQDVLTYRGLTLALMVGIITGYVVAQFI